MRTSITHSAAIGLLTVLSVSKAMAEKTTRQIYEASSDAIVLLLAYDSRGTPTSLGSGFFFERNRIASNHHVVEGASRLVYRVIGSKDVHEVKKIAAVSKALDLAILEVGEEHTPLTVVGPEKIGIGDKVVAIGNPRGLEGSVSEGIVSGVRGAGDVRFLQITTPISPGSSGGPLFTADGMVVGVTTASLRDSQSLNFAVPASYLITLREKGNSWEPVVPKDVPSPQPENAGVRLVSPKYDVRLLGTATAVQYSLLNGNDRGIRRIDYLLVFKDKGSGDVIHFALRRADDLLPPGLAKRFEFIEPAVHKYSPPPDIELRVLTYDFAEEQPGGSLLDSIAR
jgi:Trypsin-like peptidase domain